MIIVVNLPSIKIEGIQIISGFNAHSINQYYKKQRQ